MAKPDRKVVYSTDGPAGEDSPFAALRGQAEADSSTPAEPAAKPAVARSSAAKGGGAVVRVHRERKGRGGKTVSLIVGVPGPDARRLDLLKQLKHKLGAGGALEGDSIVVQGDHRDRLVEILNEMGYKAKAAGG